MRDPRAWLPGMLVVAAIAVAGLLAPRVTRAEAPPVTVVHIGDSFIDAGFRQTIGPKFAREKTRYVPLSKTSSYLGTWAGSPEMIDIFYRYRPSLYLVTLGANESMAAPQSRVATVRRIVKDLKGVPCVWVAFPAWREGGSPLNDMIRREAAPCRFYDASAIAAKMPRQKDGIHPTVEGGAMWAEAFWTWLQAERDPSRGPWALKPAP